MSDANPFFRIFVSLLDCKTVKELVVNDSKIFNNGLYANTEKIAVAKDANKLNGDSASSIDDGLRKHTFKHT